jgi:Co/Zn/Cd efflux system component
MSVDVFTYFTNMYAERVKSRAKDGEIDKQTKLYIEVLVPMISVGALIGVSIYITIEAVSIIRAYQDGSQSSDDEQVNVFFLYGFAGANLLVDIISAYMFYKRGRSAFQDPHDILYIRKRSMSISQSIDRTRSKSKEGAIGLLHHHIHASDDAPGEDSVFKRNLNMISAFTHVWCDTLRTLSVFVAAIIVSVLKLPSTLCDAWASIVVSFTIFLFIIPLLREIYLAIVIHCSVDDE